MTDQRIIYASDDGGVAVIIPAPGCGIPLQEIARKDVPPIVTYEGAGRFERKPSTFHYEGTGVFDGTDHNGNPIEIQKEIEVPGELYEVMREVKTPRPFRIIPASVIPQDRTYRDAWTADFSAPDGYGIGAEAWFAEQKGAENDPD
jgi:hypothetical protein